MLLWCLGMRNTDNLRYVCELLVPGNGNGLNQEFIATLHIERGFLLHRLQQDCAHVSERTSKSATVGGEQSQRLTRHLDFMARLNAARVWPDAVPIQRG